MIEISKNPINKDAMTYEEYSILSIEEIESTYSENLEGEEKERFEKRKLNVARSKRLNKQFFPSPKTVVNLAKIKSPQHWIVLTETLCGDSAQNVPVIAKIAKLNPNIKLQILPRDSNLEIMDQYLTDGIRGIPKLIAFDGIGNELFRWGPRPERAKELVQELRSKGYSKKEWLEELHKWYSQNRGKDTEEELVCLINNRSI